MKDGRLSAHQGDDQVTEYEVIREALQHRVPEGIEELVRLSLLCPPPN